MSSLNISNEYMASVVRKCPDAQKMMHVILEQRNHVRLRNEANKALNEENARLERIIRDMQRDNDQLRRENAELRSKP